MCLVGGRHFGGDGLYMGRVSFGEANKRSQGSPGCGRAEGGGEGTEMTEDVGEECMDEVDEAEERDDRGGEGKKDNGERGKRADRGDGFEDVSGVVGIDGLRLYGTEDRRVGLRGEAGGGERRGRGRQCEGDGGGGESMVVDE